MYLVDTNVISEARKGGKANSGVRRFSQDVTRAEAPVFIRVITVGEVRRGIELSKHRGDRPQAKRTRNTGHFSRLGLPVLKPFDQA